MEELIEDLERRKAKAQEMGGPQKVAQQHALGRYTARERVARLTDADSFVELGMLNTSEYPGAAEKSPADGLVCGVAKVDGRPVVVEATDKTVFAGAEGSVHIRKFTKLHALATRRGLPLLNLAEGGGLRIPDGMGSDGISENVFPMPLLRHGRETPYITGIMGDSYGMPTWCAVSSDYAVQVKGTCMSIAGPRMLEIATSEQISPEELGGWKVHAEHTGQVDGFAEDDDGCIAMMKAFLAFMPQNQREEPPYRATGDDPDRRLDEALKIVPTRMRRAYDMRKLLRILVDEGRFLELKADFGKALITALARMNGRVVGIMASQPLYYAGASGPFEADKAIEFICLCDSYNVPMVFLHDVPGFYIGSKAERMKMPTKIMVWNQALAWSTVPKISVVIRKSIGAAFANMCGAGMGNDFLVAWPSADINFTGPEVGVNVVYHKELAHADNPEAQRQELLKRWAFESSPYKAAARNYLDDIIDPRDTRKYICRTLDVACHKHGSMGEHLLANWPTGY
ncbi:MAG: methylmalonyl-CoA decarboxylase [Candidatus Lambdaproteobacteria bacterium]|nr:methylmalonyl-CoA decarboxylase [Candidatus Lambdaproteobacteria bacterium]